MADFAKMLLYDGGRAPNPRRVQIFLAEKGIDIPRRRVDISSLEQRSPQFTQVNPMQRLPVLVLEDGTALAETIAICRYIEELSPEPALFGRSALERAIIEMWQRRIEFNFMLPVTYAFRHLHPAAAPLESPQIEVWGQLGQKRARQFMEFIDRELAEREYMAGGSFTIADITAFVSYQFLKPARIGYPEDLPHLSAWYERVAARPSTEIRA